MMKTMSKRLLLSIAGAAALNALANYPTSDMININISNDTAYRMLGNGETETLAGLLPDNSWQNTSNADRTDVWHSGDARNGYKNGVTAWDGVNQQVVTLNDVIFTWAVEGNGTANYGWVDAANNPVFHKAWLARKSTDAETSTILLQNIPYERYDVIAYCFGADDTAFNPISVNGIYYVGDTTLEAETKTRLATSSSDTWGGRRAQPSLGQTAIRVNGLTSPELLLSIRSGVTSICAVQIVRDMSAVGGEVLAEGKVISVNLQSSYDTNGYKSESYGLVRVPASAWTEDGLSSASDGGANVTAAIREWNGATKTSYALSGITINEKAANAWRAYKYNNNGYGDYIPIANLINSYLDDGGNYARITVEGVPYKQYDVIVYTATDSSNKQFGPVTVNGTSYRWSDGTTAVAESSSSTESTRWGQSLCPVPAYGVNALRITGQTSSTLTITGANNANSARGGIAGFQIVDTYTPPSENVEPGGTIEVLELPADEVRYVCDGSLTVIGTTDHTVTEDDLRQFDFRGVTGTVTLGAHTCYTLDSDRTLPAAYSFGEGSAVLIAETREEYAKDSFSVEGLTGVSYVKLARFDGTEETLTVSAGGAASRAGNDVKIDGIATAFDFTYTNVTECAYKAPDWNVGWDADLNPLVFNDEGTGIYIKCNPWYTGIGSQLNSLEEFSVVVVGTMSPERNTQFIHFGNSNYSNTGILIATTGEKDQVLIAKNTGSTVDAANGVKASVPNAATARHAYVINKKGSVFEVWVDGVKRGQFNAGDGFRLAAGGIQVGSDHGGAIRNAGIYKNVDKTSDDTGCLYVLRFFDYAISDAQAEAVFAAYPYVSEGGLYTRTIDADADFSALNAWEDEDDNTYDEPVSATEGYNPSAAITVDGDATLTVNADVTLDTLTVGGSGTLTFEGGSTVRVVGSAIINSPVEIAYGSLDLSGAPVQIGSSGELVFDCSQFDVSSVYTTTRYQLTGNVDRSDDKITIIEPTAELGWSVSSGYNATGSVYEFVVTPDHEQGSDVYYKSGYFGKGGANPFRVVLADGTTDTHVFPGDAVVIDEKSTQTPIYVGELPDNVAAIKVNKTMVMASGDANNMMLDGATVTVAENCKLTIQHNYNNIKLGTVAFNGDGVDLDSNNGTLTVVGAVSGTSTLTVKEGKTVSVAADGSIANAVVLGVGATLDVADVAAVSVPTTVTENTFIKTTVGVGDAVTYTCAAAGIVVTINDVGTLYEATSWSEAFGDAVAGGIGAKIEFVNGTDGSAYASELEAAGFELENGVWTLAEKQGLDVGDTEEVEAATAEAAEAAVTLNISVPDEVTTGGATVDEATYASYFTPKATPAATEGTWTVTPELNAAVVLPSTDADQATEDLADVLEGDTAQLTTAKPGLFYSIEAATDLSFATPTEGTRTLATGTTVEVAKPAVSGAPTAVFYRVRVSVSAN